MKITITFLLFMFLFKMASAQDTSSSYTCLFDSLNKYSEMKLILISPETLWIGQNPTVDNWRNYYYSLIYCGEGGGSKKNILIDQKKFKEKVYKSEYLYLFNINLDKKQLEFVLGLFEYPPKLILCNSIISVEGKNKTYFNRLIFKGKETFFRNNLSFEELKTIEIKNIKYKKKYLKKIDDKLKKYDGLSIIIIFSDINNRRKINQFYKNKHKYKIYFEESKRLDCCY